MIPPLVRDSFCSFCGAPYGSPVGAYPRTCASCQTAVWSNPIPVSVVLVPIEGHAAVGPNELGLLVVRRAIEPRRGKLALVGGFLEDHETWAQGGAREIKEETGVVVDPATLSTFWFTSTEPRPNRVLLFSIASPLPVTALGTFSANEETGERGLIFGPEGLEDIFAFPLHTEAARRFFASRGQQGAHRYAIA